ncbi:MAG: zinc-ribbon domain containing protein [Terracidiphilus sp.]
MEFADRTLICIACRAEFVFTVGEQIFFSERKFTHDPTRCRPCRAKHDRLRQRPPPEVRVTCAECGIETTVPFKPHLGRPVLCRLCFQISKSLPTPAGTPPTP